MPTQVRFRSGSQALKRLMPAAELVQLAAGFRWAEGPVWLPERRRVVFSDVSGNRMYALDETGTVLTFRDPSNLANGNALDHLGRLVTCEHGTRSVSRTEHNGAVVTVADQYEGRRLNSPNDVVVRSDGTIFFTDPTDGLTPQWGIPGNQELDFQGVFRVTPDGRLSAEATDFNTPNGLAFSPDERLLYVDDTDRLHIRVFQVAPYGSLTVGEVFAEMDAGLGAGWPDGLKVDVAGNVWASGPAGIWVFSPHAQLLGIIEMPEPVTNLAWGGSDGRCLYVTTAAEDFSRSCLYRLGPVDTGGARTSGL